MDSDAKEFWHVRVADREIALADQGSNVIIHSRDGNGTANPDSSFNQSSRIRDAVAAIDAKRRTVDDKGHL
jgi:hypothetical protein